MTNSGRKNIFDLVFMMVDCDWHLIMVIISDKKKVIAALPGSVQQSDKTRDQIYKFCSSEPRMARTEV